jgi:CheY-like chemotaxis protein
MAEKADITLDPGSAGVGLAPVLADRVRLAQILINFGSNAIKYNHRGGSVHFAYKVLEDGKIRIAVADTGSGIAPERQAELFRPFSRLGAEQTGIEGTGVGLALCDRLARLMGHVIGFTSAPGQGSCFWIDVPIYVIKAHEPADARIAITGGAGDTAPATILYVEDNPSSLLLVRNIVATLPHIALIEAADGTAGLAMAAQHRPDVVILDINLPDMSGYAVFQHLKRVPELANTPVIALSAGALPRDVKRGREVGFFRYLTKPLDMTTFVEAIESALASRRSEPTRASTA